MISKAARRLALLDSATNRETLARLLPQGAKR